MPAAGGILTVLGLLLLVYCLLNVATTREDQVRTLPKPVWLLLVILLPLVGSIAWLLAGRPLRSAGTPGRGPAATPRRAPGREASARPSNPDDDEAFLRELRQRAEEQRRAARQDPEDPEVDPRP